MMPSKKSWFLLPARMLAVGALFLANVLQAQTGHPWRDGLTRQDVVAALGEPEGDVPVGNAERMIFRGGLFIVVTDGQVTSIEGPVPEALKPKAAAPTPPTPVAPATPAATAVGIPAESGKVTATGPTPSTSVVAPGPATSPAPSSTESQGDQDSEKIINDFSTTSIVPQGTTMSGVIAKALGPGKDGAGEAGSAGLPKGLVALAGSTPAADADKSPWSTEGTWQWFVAGLLLKTLIMTGVLKGTFAYKEFPVLWREAAFVAFGVSLCNQGLAALFLLNDFGKIAAMVQADQLVAGAVLLGLIMNFTAAKQFPTAAAIMISAMTVNIAVGYAQLFFL